MSSLGCILSDLEYVPGIQIAVANALTALGSPLVDTRRAGLLLYGLHLAANLSVRTSKPKIDREQLR